MQILTQEVGVGPEILHFYKLLDTADALSPRTTHFE